MKKTLDNYMKIITEEKNQNTYWANIAVKVFVSKDIKNQNTEAKKQAQEIVNKIPNARLLNVDMN